jgi:Trk K+ transport system NAD-binding subunit
VTTYSAEPLGRRRHRHDLRTVWRYVQALLWEFRWTLGLLAAAVLCGGFLFCITPQNGRCPSLATSFYSAWMALFAQSNAPETWYLALICGLYPLLGFFLIGEGIIRLAALVMSRRHGEKEWMKVMASTYRDHVVLCGLGHLGYRVLEHLVKSAVPVVAVEKNGEGRFMAQARATGAPILVQDMKEDQALIDAGVPNARVIIVASDDDMANLEVALDARRMNPKIRIIMRLFDQQIAAKVSNALAIDEAFSSSALAAPVVAGMAMDTPVLATLPIAGTTYLVADVKVEPGSVLAGRTVAQAEAAYGARIATCIPKATGVPEVPGADMQIQDGDRLVIHIPAGKLTAFSAAAKRRRPEDSGLRAE